jgi:hypothetical protein
MQTVERDNLLQEITHLIPARFTELALRVFQYQAKYNPLYAEYIRLLGINPFKINALEQIPFLPIAFFKSHFIQSGQWLPVMEFRSSATTGQIPSRHAVLDPNGYLENARKGFEAKYGAVSEWCILALLPSYLERTGSSLVFMVEDWIQRSRHPDSGFFLHDFQKLIDILQKCRENKQKTLLLGVSFALLDFAEAHPMSLQGITVMETGGMKGRRKELTRDELHQQLKQAFDLERIHSEYGMTELFSQAYLQSNGYFESIATMKVLCGEINDPFAFAPPGKSGILHIIDLANLDTCSFIATEDIGRVQVNGQFQVMGRLDMAEMRGCNLMMNDE